MCDYIMPMRYDVTFISSVATIRSFLFQHLVEF